MPKRLLSVEVDYQNFSRVKPDEVKMLNANHAEEIGIKTDWDEEDDSVVEERRKVDKAVQCLKVA